MANVQYGVTLTGFVPKQQATIISEIQASFQQAYGQGINLSSESIFGQMIGVFSEREALVWQLAEAVYASQYPNGAEGTSVDNILALNGLKRLPASPSKTTLVLYGTPGTYIQSGSIVSLQGNHLVQFTTDLAVTIMSSVNAIQSIIFSNVPTQGSFVLSIVDPAGNTLTTSAIPYTANAAAVQAAIAALNDTTVGNFPYTDVVVTGTFGTGFTFQFGAATPTSGQPSSGGQFQNPFLVVSNSLQKSSTVTTLVINQNRLGALAQGSTTATCTQDGPTYAPGGFLNVIGNPVSGWTSVTNPLDAILGTNIEDDTTALLRRDSELASNSNGPIQGIVDKVKLVTSVSQAIGFENTKITPDNSTQKITFTSVPDAGSFVLQIGSSGSNVTSSLPFNVTFSQLQTAIQAISGYSGVNVTGDTTEGFILVFGSGFEDQTLSSVVTNTLMSGALNVIINIQGGRPGKSFEIVAQGGADTDIATAIYKAKPAGIQPYGNSGPFVISDSDGFDHPIYFSRPTLVPIYIIVNITGNTATFPSDGAQTIQADLVSIGNSLKIGQTVITFGSNGLVGAFNNVPGIISYTMFVGTTSNPTTNSNILMQSEQLAQFESFNVVVNLSLS